MYRTDYIIALVAFCGVLLVAGFTYYFLKDPSGDVVTISPVPQHFTAQRQNKSVTGREREPLAKSRNTKTDIQRQKLDPQSTQEESSIILTSLATAGLPPSMPQTDSSPETTPSPRTVLPDVHFDFDRGGLPAEAKKQLDHHANLLRGSDWSILIQGHTDNRGTLRHNMRLGLRRAQTVKDYLVNKGVKKSHIEVVSLGEYEPACQKSGESCRRQNRRVHFSLARFDTPTPSLPAMAESTTILEKITTATTSHPTLQPQPMPPATLSTESEQKAETLISQELTSQLINIEDMPGNKIEALSDKETPQQEQPFSQDIEPSLPTPKPLTTPAAVTPSQEDKLSFFPSQETLEVLP
jgi:outer membrane protein OmpA-like peptidoglycan-associated protein